MRQRPRWSLPSDGYSRLGLAASAAAATAASVSAAAAAAVDSLQYDRVAAARPGWQYQAIERGVGWTRAVPRGRYVQAASHASRSNAQTAERHGHAHAGAGRGAAWLARRSHHGAASIRPLSWPQTRPDGSSGKQPQSSSRCAGTKSGNSALYLPLTADTTVATTADTTAVTTADTTVCGHHCLWTRLWTPLRTPLWTPLWTRPPP